MISSQSTLECGYGQGIASGCVSVTRGTNEQTKKPGPANVVWMVGGRCTRPVFGWYFSMANAQGYTKPSQPTTSSQPQGDSRRALPSSTYQSSSPSPFAK